MAWITRAADKAGALGTIVSAASCPACFPALAGLGTAMGLEFLAGHEDLFIDKRCNSADCETRQVRP
ncbi:hypothetical protein VAR608DRAFT_2957 [Variovorax sp. HW608]|uniref:hypothetical protein n=1 Tax=Variovorax sp. HW608 TaxID=1034889 RepID=UPI00081FE296|nr:hypothetical protein VAR608DRAFT_2957 [Variovorax sp. HW608]